MDTNGSISNLIKLVYLKRKGQDVLAELIKSVCEYFDVIKNERLSEGDIRFLRYIASEAGVPQYFSMLNKFDNGVSEREYDVHLDMMPVLVEESALYTADSIQLHKYQMDVLSRFILGERNRYFLSASTSFGKTFLIFEIIRKMQYDNVCLVFPTIALLSENIQKIFSDPLYTWIKERYKIHTLSDADLQEHNNLFIFTPERYLSFLDKNADYHLDFFFVDEVYKIDNDFLVDDQQKENERDVAYRISTHIGLNQTTDCLLAGPYINIDLSDTEASIVKFLDWANITLLDYNRFEIVGKCEYQLEKKKKIKLIDDDTMILFSSSSKRQKLKELVKELVRRNENAIIYCSSKTGVEKYAKLLLEADGLPEISTDDFNPFYNHLSNLFQGGKGAHWIVTKALQRGVGVHHGLVPKYIQNEIIRLFNIGVLKVLVVTTTITEGVNTTAKNMVVLSHKKGRKGLKPFDAKNIEGRAGRFIHHYIGRVFILDNDFKTIVDSRDEFLRHKFFDSNIKKQPVDFPYVNDTYLSVEELTKKRWVDSIVQANSIPEGVITAYKTISVEDKYHLYETVKRLTDTEKYKIKHTISTYNGTGHISKAGIEVIFEKIKSIVPADGELLSLIERRREGSAYCTLTNMVAVFLKNGFVGAVNFYSQSHDIDESVRRSAKFVFNILRYQVVKYIGVFNLCYKYFLADEQGIVMDEVAGLDSIMMKMEYNASTILGRKASDAGASFRVIDYYDKLSKDPKTTAYGTLDQYEKSNADKIREIVNS